MKYILAIFLLSSLAVLMAVDTTIILANGAKCSGKFINCTTDKITIYEHQIIDSYLTTIDRSIIQEIQVNGIAITYEEVARFKHGHINYNNNFKERTINESNMQTLAYSGKLDMITDTEASSESTAFNTEDLKQYTNQVTAYREDRSKSTMLIFTGVFATGCAVMYIPYEWHTGWSYGNSFNGYQYGSSEGKEGNRTIFYALVVTGLAATITGSVMRADANSHLRELQKKTTSFYISPNSDKKILLHFCYNF